MSRKVINKYFIEKQYVIELKKIVKMKIPGTSKKLGNSLTYGSDLFKVAKKMFGVKFRGVYTADQVNKLRTGKNGYFIYNLDFKNEPGSHWLAISKYGPKGQNIMIYDSYGRKTEDILPTLTKVGRLRLKDTERDAEQSIFQSNCGARSLSFLKIFDKYGPKKAKYV